MKREMIEKWLTKNGWKVDRFGHFHKFKMTTANVMREARIKMQENSLRYEIVKEGGEFSILATDFYDNCDIIDKKLHVNNILIG